MRLSIFLLCTAVFGFTSIDSFSQEKISVKKDVELSVDELFKIVLKQTDFSFLYPENLFEEAAKISLKKGDIELKSLLESIFLKNNVTYRLSNKNIIIEKYSNISEVNTIQQLEIKGNVVDSNGNPMPGANILEKGTNNGAQSDFDGNFIINVSDSNAVLVVSYIGFITAEIAVKDQKNIEIVLNEDIDSLSEVVVVGYGSLSRSKVIGAVSSVKSEDINQLPVGGIDQAIAGRVAGVQVVSSGAPGAGSQIKIRGVGTITAGRSPLIVVDGYPLTEGSDLNSVNPSDIQSIEVLKDAASTSIYGSRGANGVLLVTTKTSKSDKTEFNFDTFTGFQSVLNPMKFLNAYQFAQVVKEARDWGYVSADPNNRSIDDNTATRLANGASPRHIIPSNFDKYLAGTPGLTDNDWLDSIFREGQLKSYNLSASGRSNLTKWIVSGGYYQQEGLIIGSGYDRYSSKLSLETKFNDNIKFGINLNPSISTQNSVVEGWTDSPMQQAILMEPFFTPYNDEGQLNISQQIRWHNLGGTDGALAENPVAIALQKKDEKNKFRLFGSTFVEIDLFEGLKFKSLFGGDFDYSIRQQFRPSTIGAYRRDANSSVPSANERIRTRKNYISENTLTYDKNINNHNINLLAGYSYQKEHYEYTEVNAPLLNSNDIQNVAGSASTTSKKAISEWFLISYFSRLQYDFDSKYLFSASIRRDGSSRFGANKKFGYFPSFSGGWVVSNEDFFPQESMVNNLKVRYSWGKTGNNQIGDYGSIAVLDQLNGIINGNLASGLRPESSPNADLTWETSITNNIGLDVSFFDSKLNLYADYFVAKTVDMLLNVPVPQQSGFSSSLQNIGSMENKGLELMLSSADINLGKVKWNSSVNFSKINNKVLALAPGQEQIIAGGTNITRVGSPIGQFYGYVVDGIYKSQSEIDNSAQSGTDVRVGDWRIVDVDGNGSISSKDRTIIGSALPDFTYGFNNRFAYKNLDLNIFVDGVEGVDVLSRTLRNASYGQTFSNQIQWYFENRWHPTNNPNGTLPRPDYTFSSQRGLANVSNAYVTDASFLRVRNITLGYTLPSSEATKLGMKKLRLYVTAKNPLMITDFKGYNPEQSRSNPLDPSDTEGSYPMDKSFVLGLNVTF